MTLPDMDTLDTYGGVKVSRGLQYEPSAARTAEEVSTGYAAIAAVSTFCIRAWARISFTCEYTTINGHDYVNWHTGAGEVLQHASVWSGSAPVCQVVKEIDGHELLNPTGLEVAWPETVADALSADHDLLLSYFWTNPRTVWGDIGPLSLERQDTLGDMHAYVLKRSAVLLSLSGALVFDLFVV